MRSDLIIMVVKSIAKYITLLLFVAISAIGYASNSETSVAKTEHSEVVTELSTTIIESAAQNVELSLSHQAPIPSTIQLHSATKRTSNAHKNNFEFTKSGKCFSTCIGGYIHQHQLSTRLSFTKSHHRLIGLGKLII